MGHVRCAGCPRLRGRYGRSEPRANPRADGIWRHSAGAARGRLAVGGFNPELYQAVRLYHADRDLLTEPVWLGSALKSLGGYLEEPRLDAAEMERPLARIAERAAVSPE
jgi:hypothetical protein